MGRQRGDELNGWLKRIPIADLEGERMESRWGLMNEIPLEERMMCEEGWQQQRAERQQGSDLQRKGVRKNGEDSLDENGLTQGVDALLLQKEERRLTEVLLPWERDDRRRERGRERERERERAVTESETSFYSILFYSIVSC